MIVQPEEASYRQLQPPAPQPGSDAGVVEEVIVASHAGAASCSPGVQQKPQINVQSVAPSRRTWSDMEDVRNSAEAKTLSDNERKMQEVCT